jgi:polyisoprenyl-teichoic acid--peptidoglycan teichoic acid transferase
VNTSTRPRTRTIRSLGILGACVVLTGVLIAGLCAAAWLAIGAPAASATNWFQVTKFDSNYSGAPDQPFYFLALGNDGRTDADVGLGDAIHVIGVNPALNQATMLNVPRDTTAPSGDKINAYHSLEGLPGIIRELNQMMGIQISYAITTNFPGFMEMVNQLGGIDVNIPMPLSDPDGSGADFPIPGPQLVAGEGALAFARDRHDFTGGDIDRSFNQGTIILSALGKIQQTYNTPSETMRLLSILALHVRMENVGLTELFRLGRLSMGLDPAAIKNITIPTGGGSGTNLAVAPQAQQLFADFADDAVVQSQ